MKYLKSIAVIAIIVLLVTIIATRAQTFPVFLIAAPAGSTLTNCGTPATPSVCVVTSGVYFWQNATQGWFLAAQPAAAGVTSWNGLTGVVTYAPPPDAVTSVNGKTGTVVLNATIQ